MVQTEEGAVPSGVYDDLLAKYRSLLELNQELTKQNEDLKKRNHKLKREHERMEFDLKQAKDQLDQVFHEVKVMGNARNYIEAQDLVKRLDSNLQDDKTPIIVSPRDLSLMKQTSLKMQQKSPIRPIAKFSSKKKVSDIVTPQSSRLKQKKPNKDLEKDLKSADSFFEEEPVSEREVLFSNPVINGSKKGEDSSNLIPKFP